MMVQCRYSWTAPNSGDQLRHCVFAFARIIDYQSIEGLCDSIECRMQDRWAPSPVCEATALELSPTFCQTWWKHRKDILTLWYYL